MRSLTWPDWDAVGFGLVHRVWTHPLLDTLLPIWRDKSTWVPVYAIAGILLLLRFRSRALLLLVGAGAAVGIADGLSSAWLKPLFGRLRPCRDTLFAGPVRDLIACGPGLSFPSSHAANHMALALFLVLASRNRYPWISASLLLWAVSIAYAQVYVGLHYPLDALGGLLVGAVAATATTGVYRLSLGLLTRRQA